MRQACSDGSDIYVAVRSTYVMAERDEVKRSASKSRNKMSIPGQLPIQTRFCAPQDCSTLASRLGLGPDGAREGPGSKSVASGAAELRCSALAYALTTPLMPVQAPRSDRYPDRRCGSQARSRAPLRVEHPPPRRYTISSTP